MPCMFQYICKDFDETAHYCATNYEARNCTKALKIRKAIKEVVAEE